MAWYGRGSSKKSEHGCRMIHAGVPSFHGLGLEDGHVPTFWASTVRLRKADIVSIVNPNYMESEEEL